MNSRTLEITSSTPPKSIKTPLSLISIENSGSKYKLWDHLTRVQRHLLPRLSMPLSNKKAAMLSARKLQVPYHYIEPYQFLDSKIPLEFVNTYSGVGLPRLFVKEDWRCIMGLK